MKCVLELSEVEAMTLAQIAQHVQRVHEQALPYRLETLGEALKRNGFSFKHNRYTLKKTR